MSTNGWIAVDFDGTLAHYDHWRGPAALGAPVAPMVERVKRWLAEGREVRVFTARVWPILFDSKSLSDTLYHIDSAWDMDNAENSQRCDDAVKAVMAIRAWCIEHLGQRLNITCVKDMGMIELYDDRAVQVEANTGRLVGASTRGLS